MKTARMDPLAQPKLRQCQSSCESTWPLRCEVSMREAMPDTETGNLATARAGSTAPMCVADMRAEGTRELKAQQTLHL